MENRNTIFVNICDVLHDLVTFVQFKKGENTHAGVTFCKVADLACNFIKSNTETCTLFKETRFQVPIKNTNHKDMT